MLTDQFNEFLLSVVVAHFKLSSKRRATIISTLPPNLPDTRTAQRLLDIFAQLEQSLRMGQQHNRQAGNAASAELNNRVANLQFENQRLRANRQQAAQRLSLLMERLQQQLEADTETTPAAQDEAA